jgi:hypothetical protein
MNPTNTQAPAQAPISPALHAAGIAAQLIRFGGGDPTYRMTDQEIDAMLTAQRRRVVMIARHILAATAELETVTVKPESEAGR